MRQELGRNNIIFYIYYHWFKKRMFLFISSVFCISFIVPAFFCYLNNSLLPNDLIEKGFLQDPAGYLAMLGLPAACFLFIKYIENLQYKVKSILRSNIILSEIKGRDIYDKFIKIYNDKRLNLIAFAVLLFSFYPINYTLSIENIVWNGTFQNGERVITFAGYYSFLFLLPLFSYIMLFLAAYMIVTIFILKNMSKQSRIKVDPFHQDGCGGLADIGNLAFFNIYPIILVGLLISIWIVTDYFTPYFNSQFGIFALIHILTLLLYLTLSSIMFLLPIFMFHKLMVKERNKFLNTISEKFNQIYQSLEQNKDDHSKFIESLENIEKLKSYNELAKIIPVWPLNIALFRKFSFLILSPFSMFILPAFFDKYVIPYLF